ncbi:adenosylcobinamide-GDP ribazoletransferase [Modestobacter sp. SYSU DS0657]
MSRRWWSGPVEAFSLLSAVRMPPVGSVRGALPWAPLVGLVLGSAATAVAWAADRAAGPLVGAVLGVVVLAVATRGLHLDGLADTADGLGPLRGRERALQVMRSGDVGPFGVATLVLTLLLQVACLAHLLTVDGGWLALPAATLTARLAMARTGLPGVPIAEGSSLGQAVAGTVSRPWLAGAALLTAAAVTGGALFAGRDGPVAALVLVAAVAAGLGASEALLSRARSRLGGVNGDVMGAMGEVAATVTLLATALLLG